MWKALGTEPAFAYVSGHIFINDKANMLTSRIGIEKFLTGFLNSKLFQWIFKSIGVGMGLGFEYKIQFMEKIPIPPLNPENQSLVAQIESLVDQILARKRGNPNADTRDLERAIDDLVYRLYDLTPDEIRLVEGM